MAYTDTPWGCYIILATLFALGLWAIRTRDNSRPWRPPKREE